MRLRSALPILVAMLAIAADPPAAVAAPSPHADHAGPVAPKVVAHPLHAMVITLSAGDYAAPILVLRAESAPTVDSASSSDSVASAELAVRFEHSTVPPGALNYTDNSHVLLPIQPTADYLLVAHARERLGRRAGQDESVGGGHGGPSMEGRHPLGNGAFRRLAPPAA